MRWNGGDARLALGLGPCGGLLTQTLGDFLLAACYDLLCLSVVDHLAGVIERAFELFSGAFQAV